MLGKPLVDMGALALAEAALLQVEESSTRAAAKQTTRPCAVACIYRHGLLKDMFPVLRSFVLPVACINCLQKACTLVDDTRVRWNEAVSTSS